MIGIISTLIGILLIGNGYLQKSSGQMSLGAIILIEGIIFTIIFRNEDKFQRLVEYIRTLD